MSSSIDRRGFLETSVKALLAVASVHIVGCEKEKYEITTDASGALTIQEVTPTNGVDLTLPQATADVQLATEGTNSSGGVGGSGDEETEGGGPCTPSGCSQLSDNLHTHSCSLSGSTSIKLNCFAGHKHSLSLSAADLDTLCSAGSITKTSSVDSGHSHDVVINA